MATVLTFTTGDKFIVTIRKSLVTEPGVRWVNRYELRAREGGVLADLNDALYALLTAEQYAHMEIVHFDQGEVATWEPDNIPYQPETFYTAQFDTVGMVSLDDTPVALDVCFVLRRQAVTGRNGMLAYRGCLQESDIFGSGSGWAYTPAGVTRTDAVLAALLPAIVAYLPGGDAPLEIVMITADGGVTRNVVTLVKGKIATIPTDHRWFNRYPSHPGPVEGEVLKPAARLTRKGRAYVARQK